MKRLRLVLVAALSVLCVVSGASAIAAEAPSSPSGDQVAFIRANCNTLKASLSRVHANDGLVRVNHGRLYEQLATKLMAPFNSRVASNRLDGSLLVSATSTFEKHVEEFRAAYQRYDVALANVLKIPCKDKPTSFYEELLSAQKLRAEVRRTVDVIESDIEQYREAFEEFREDSAS